MNEVDLEKQDDPESDEDDDRLDAVRKNQYDQMQHFVMVDDHPDSNCATSSTVLRNI